MCGIAAILGGQPQAMSLLGAMSETLQHRGPDDEGLVFLHPAGASLFGGPDTPEEVLASGLSFAPSSRFAGAPPEGAWAGLAHRRLAVIERSASGHQPMATPDLRYWITCDGELYNARELRAELAERGHRFFSQADTEVILAAYAEWGPECLHRFNGSWAFVLVDRQERRVFAARDRFGMKPLYTWRSPEGFLALASEIKAFTVLPGWTARLNGQRAYDFLAWGMRDHTEETLFAGVRQLRGGEAFEASWEALASDLPVYRWYVLQPRPFAGSFAEAVDAFRDLLQDALRLRLRADVPVGACLSGGLDSSSIVCVADDLTEGLGRQRIFSAVSDVPRYDEREYLDEVLHSRRLEAHLVTPSHDALFEDLAALAWHQDEPFNSTSVYAQWLVFKLAAEHGVRVMLDGQGADEQLAGYHGFFGARFAQLLRTLRWRSLFREIRESERLHGYGPMSALRKMATVLLPGPMQDLMHRLEGASAAAPDWLNLSVLGARALDPVEAHGPRPRTIQELSIAQLTATHLPMALHWEDRNAMAHGVAVRVPYLDHRLVEFALGLPDAYKLSEGVTKRVQREAMTGILPERVRLRMDKMGFVTPEEVWLRERAPERFRAAVSDAVAASHGILADSARAMVEETIAGRAIFTFAPWRLISFGRWLEAFDVQPPGRSA